MLEKLTVNLQFSTLSYKYAKDLTAFEPLINTDHKHLQCYYQTRSMTFRRMKEIFFAVDLKP